MDIHRDLRGFIVPDNREPNWGIINQARNLGRDYDHIRATNQAMSRPIPHNSPQHLIVEAGILGGMYRTGRTHQDNTSLRGFYRDESDESSDDDSTYVPETSESSEETGESSEDQSTDDSRTNGDGSDGEDFGLSQRLQRSSLSDSPQTPTQRTPSAQLPPRTPETPSASAPTAYHRQPLSQGSFDTPNLFSRAGSGPPAAVRPRSTITPQGAVHPQALAVREMSSSAEVERMISPGASSFGRSSFGRASFGGASIGGASFGGLSQSRDVSRPVDQQDQRHPSISRSVALSIGAGSNRGPTAPIMSTPNNSARESTGGSTSSFVETHSQALLRVQAKVDAAKRGFLHHQQLYFAALEDERRLHTAHQRECRRET